MEAVIERAPVIVRTPPPVLRYRVCQCQMETDPSYALYEIETGGTSVPASSLKPMDICMLCQDIFVSQSPPCKYCGRIPGGPQ